MKKTILLLLTLALCLTLAGCDSSDYKEATELYNAGQYEEAMAIFEELGTYKDSKKMAENCQWHMYKVGDTVTLGKYEQNGLPNSMEAIEWDIIAIDGDRLFLLSKYYLDVQQYNTTNIDVTWETCSMRKWLNNDFLNTAFSEDEQETIATTQISTPDTVVSYMKLVYKRYPTGYYQETEDGGAVQVSGGNDTFDKLFLLSNEEFNLFEIPKGSTTKYVDNFKKTGAGEDLYRTSLPKTRTDDDWFQFHNSKEWRVTSYGYVRPAMCIDLSAL